MQQAPKIAAIIAITLILPLTAWSREASLTSWHGFKNSGLAEGMKYNPITSKAKAKKEANYFDASVEEITWFATTRLKLYNLGLKQPTFNVTWYAPDESVFLEETLTRPAYKGYYAKSVIKIKDGPAEKIHGRSIPNSKKIKNSTRCSYAKLYCKRYKGQSHQGLPF